MTGVWSRYGKAHAEGQDAVDSGCCDEDHISRALHGIASNSLQPGVRFSQ